MGLAFTSAFYAVGFGEYIRAIVGVATPDARSRNSATGTEWALDGCRSDVISPSVDYVKDSPGSQSFAAVEWAKYQSGS